MFIAVNAGLAEFNRIIMHYDRHASGLSYMDYG